MSELVTEYTHVVADLKPFVFFDVMGCLKILPWSVSECYSHIYPHWFKGSFLTRHAVVQLALWACPPFRHPPDGSISDDAIYDRYPRVVVHGGKRRPSEAASVVVHRYPCPSLIDLIEAVAAGLLTYEDWCEDWYPWPAFQKQRTQCTTFLTAIKRLFSALQRRGYAPTDPTLRHKRTLKTDIQQIIDVVQSFSYEDYCHAGALRPTPRDPGTQLLKWMLLTDLVRAFTQHPLSPSVSDSSRVSSPWAEAAAVRCVAAIVNHMKITNADGKAWTPDAIKRVLARGPSPRTRLAFIFNHPRGDPVDLNTKPE